MASHAYISTLSQSSLDPLEVGLGRWIEDPSHRMVALSFAVDGGEIVTWLPQGNDAAPAGLLDALRDPETKIWVPHGGRARLEIGRALHIDIPTFQVRCMSAACGSMTLPHDLVAACEALGISIGLSAADRRELERQRQDPPALSLIQDLEMDIDRMRAVVRHQSFWASWRPDLREGLAHLVGVIMRRICGEASAGFRLSVV